MVKFEDSWPETSQTSQPRRIVPISCEHGRNASVDKTIKSQKKIAFG